MTDGGNVNDANHPLAQESKLCVRPSDIRIKIRKVHSVFVRALKTVFQLLNKLIVFSGPIVQNECTISPAFFINGGMASNSSCVKLLST